MVFRVYEYQLTNKRDNIYAIVEKLCRWKRRAFFLWELTAKLAWKMHRCIQGRHVNAHHGSFCTGSSLTCRRYILQSNQSWASVPGPKLQLPIPPTPYAWLGVGGYYSASRWLRANKLGTSLAQMPLSFIVANSLPLIRFALLNAKLFVLAGWRPALKSATIYHNRTSMSVGNPDCRFCGEL